MDRKMVGICSIENTPVGKNKDMLNLGLLWVSKNARRKGIASELIFLTKKEVYTRNFTRLYISATPSKSSVDFYIKMGCRLTDDIDSMLFNMEPEDIHFELLCV